MRNKKWMMLNEQSPRRKVRLYIFLSASNKVHALWLLPCCCMTINYFITTAKEIVPFRLLDEESKAKFMLSCFTELEYAVEAVHGNIGLTPDHITNEISKIPSSVHDKLFDLSIIEMYCSKACFKKIQSHIETLENNPQWICNICSTNIGKKHSIACERCLKWYHFTCTKLKRKPRDDWFCMECQELANKGTLH